MHFLADYGLYLAKVATLVIAILIVIAGIAAIAARAKMKDKTKGKLSLCKLNDKYDDMIDNIQQDTLPKKALKAYKKLQKENIKKNLKSDAEKPRLFVINFNGDIRASAVQSLREEVNAVLLTIKPKDKVLVRLESGGGIVNAYGLAAAQLQRLRAAHVDLTIAVDKIAASGGYMMACVANHIIASPFAVVGSIGVLAQLPNFHRYLDKHKIDFEQITAGEYKRTLTVFGKNTDKGRAKLKADVEDIHALFKDFIKENRPHLDLVKVATGETWFGSKAQELQLIDSLQTSDDYILGHRDNFDIYELQYKIKMPMSKRLSIGFSNVLAKVASTHQTSGQDYL